MNLSIITINYNNCEGLKKTLDSVLKQSIGGFEHVIVDGDSSDGSKDLIVNYVNLLDFQDKQIHCRWVSEKDKGIYNAMNKGITMAEGEYLLFLNSGDYFAEVNVLERLFSNPFDEDIVYCDMLLDDAGRKIPNYSPDKVTMRTFYKDTIHHSGCALIKKTLFEKFGMYDENLKIVSDWKFFMQSVVLGNATTRHIRLFMSCFDMCGISSMNEALCDSERERVLKETIPSRILDDYGFYENQIRSPHLSQYTYAQLLRGAIRRLLNQIKIKSK